MNHCCPGLAVDVSGPSGSVGDGRDGRAGCGRGRADRGSGTILALGLIGVVITLGFFLAALGAAQAAHARARSAADLAALAGATALRYGQDGCTAASQTASRGGAVLDACTDEGGGVLRVDVHRDLAGASGHVRSWLGGGAATAAARAGPQSARTPARSDGGASDGGAVAGPSDP